MFEVIGIIAITLVFGYIFFWFFAMGLFPMVGFDEFNIPVGLALWTFAAVTAGSWWYLVGQHINISFSIG